MISAFRIISGRLVVEQFAGEVIDYGFDWTDRLEAEETISSSVWSADAGLAVTAPQVDGLVTSAFVGSGVAGQRYQVRNTVSTSGSRTFVQSVEFRIV